MVMDIMYYGMDTSSSEQDGLKIGPYINVTVEQLCVGVITNLVVFPPTFLLMQLFRRSKRRRPRLLKIKDVLGQPLKITEKNRKKNVSQLRFPWWFKIFAYVLSFAFAAVSLFFVVIKGIVFGNTMVTKWLTAVLISLLSEILLTKPITVRNGLN